MYTLLDPETSTGPTKELLEATRKQLGRVPNLYRAMANSPKALSAYLGFRGALQQGALDAALCERVALLVAELNSCDYCVAAHHFRGGKLGLSASDLSATRRGHSDDARIDAALTFVTALVRGHGSVADTAREAVFAAGWNEAEVGELVAHVALNVFSNYFKQIARPELDFPAAPALA